MIRTHSLVHYFIVAVVAAKEAVKLRRQGSRSFTYSSLCFPTSLVLELRGLQTRIY